MSRITKIVLLTMAAFLVLGFSVTAYADKPDKPQVMRSAAIPGYWHNCNATNIADREIFVTWKLLSESGFEQDDKTEWIPAGETYSLVRITGTFSRCVISWVGQPGEIRGSFCSYYANNPANIGACLDLF